jgi:cold shock protein
MAATAILRRFECLSDNPGCLRVLLALAANLLFVHTLEKSKETTSVATGTVKWFNGQKGFGFIQPDAGGKDVFVHISAVEKAGLPGLNEGQKISYEIVTDRGKESAGNLRA